MKHEGWAPTDLSPAESALIDRYEESLRTIAVPRGMVSRSDEADLHVRHVLDSLRAVPHLPGAGCRLCDMGSGAGLPGIPLAIARADLRVTLVEPRQARAAFLELMVERLPLPHVTVFPGPVRDLGSEFDACVARGFGSASRSWEAARRLLAPGGRLLYWAGASFGEHDAPAGTALEVVPPDLESSGPIVIMTRQ